MNWRDLIKAARVKLQLGWVQGSWEYPSVDGPPRYCMLGALDAVHREVSSHSSARAAARRRLAAAIRRRENLPLYGDPELVIMRFNDNFIVTHETVLAVMDEAGEGK